MICSSSCARKAGSSTISHLQAILSDSHSNPGRVGKHSAVAKRLVRLETRSGHVGSVLCACLKLRRTLIMWSGAGRYSRRTSTILLKRPMPRRTPSAWQWTRELQGTATSSPARSKKGVRGRSYSRKAAALAGLPNRSSTGLPRSWPPSTMIVAKLKRNRAKVSPLPHGTRPKATFKPASGMSGFEATEHCWLIAWIGRYAPHPGRLATYLMCSEADTGGLKLASVRTSRRSEQLPENRHRPTGRAS